MKKTLAPILILLAGRALATTYPMTMHTVVDNRAVHGVAFRYLAPKGWKTTAILNWVDNVLSPTELFLGGASADDRFGFALISSLDFPFGGHAAGPYGGGGYQNGKQPPRVLSDFLVEHVKTLFPKTQIEVTKREDKPLNGSDLPYKRNFGMASQIEFSYSVKGQAFTGAAAARCDGNALSSDQGMGAHWNGDWKVENLVVVMGPKGEEKKAMQFFALSVPSITATRQFAALRYAYVDMLNKQMTADMKAQFERGQLQFKATQEQNAKGFAAWREHEAATDKSMQGFTDYLGGVERFKGANGEEIKATATVGGAWQDLNGNVMLSDTPNYSPGVGWTKLQHAN